MKEKKNINTYLIFSLDDEIYGANVKKVLNILEMRIITKVPQVPSYMKGVINFRGNVLPVIDLRIKFGLIEKEVTEDTCIIVLNIDIDGKSIFVGAMVDAVKEVIEIDLNKTDAAPSIGKKYKADFIHGMWKHDDSFVMLLNIDMILTQDEIQNVKQTQTESELSA